jgi:hypothetical protein
VWHGLNRKLFIFIINLAESVVRAKETVDFLIMRSAESVAGLKGQLYFSLYDGLNVLHVLNLQLVLLIL